jgi:putative multiple sugar transport system permease protein
VLLGLVLGALIGAWQGWWTAYVGIPAFIVTLAGMLLFRGFNQFVGKSNTIPVPADFQYLGSGYLPEVGPNTGFNNLTLLLGIAAAAFVVFGELRSRARAKALGAEVPEMWVTALKLVLICGAILYATYLFATGRPGTSFPIPGLILAVLVLVYGFVSSRTILGRHVYAVGGNRHAAELSGVQSKKVNFLVMMNMSILAGLAGMIFVGRSTASGPFDGVGWELDAIAAVFIGGAAVTGGVGTVVGSIIGGLVMAVLNNGLQLLGIGADLTQIIKGLVLLIAVAFDVYNKSQGKKSIIGMLTRNFNRPAGGGPSNPLQPDETTSTKEAIAREA